jgi:hypothetical protein
MIENRERELGIKELKRERERGEEKRRKGQERKRKNTEESTRSR